MENLALRTLDNGLVYYSCLEKFHKVSEYNNEWADILNKLNAFQSLKEAIFSGEFGFEIFCELENLIFKCTLFEV